MRIVITGADRPMGAALCRGLVGGHDVTAVGARPRPDLELGTVDEYRSVDLRRPEAAHEAVAGGEIVVHAQPNDIPLSTGADAEQELLDVASRGTFVLVNAAREAGIGRIVLVSTIALMQDYPEGYVIEPFWRPNPGPDGASLAPYLAELVCREIARAGKIEVRCLRMGRLDADAGTTAADAVQAVEEALTSDIRGRGYCWQQDHVVSGGRFALDGG
jgi:nucleoside-diphosphate-sugar epimerase